MVPSIIVLFLVALPSMALSKKEEEVVIKELVAPEKIDVDKYYPYTDDFRQLLDRMKAHMFAERPTTPAPVPETTPPMIVNPPFKRFETEVEDMMRTLSALLNKVTFAIDKLLDDIKIHYY